MSDTLITVVAILLAAILMFIFPLLSVSERSDDISQLSVQTATTEFVDNSRAIGKITMNNYTKLRVDMALGLAVEHKNLKFLKNWNRYNG